MPSVTLAALPASAPAPTATTHAQNYPLPSATPTPTPTPTATAHNYPLPSITVQPVPSLHRLTEVIWVKISQTMVPIVTNDSGGTIYYEVFRMVAKSHTKWANFLGPKSIGNRGTTLGDPSRRMPPGARGHQTHRGLQGGGSGIPGFRYRV